MPKRLCANLDETWGYVYEELQSLQGAYNTVDGITKEIDRLQDFAGLGSVLSSITDIQSEYRFLVCGAYLAFYRVAGADVYIDRILHGKRDYLRVLFTAED